MAELVPAHQEFVEGVATRDVVVDFESGLPELNPEEVPSKLPIILHFHGGGFCTSEADWYMYYYIYARLACMAKAICISVYLRRAPEHCLPAACDDSYSALLWLQDVAQGELHNPWLDTNGDLTRVFLIGDSSGGNLVHEVAARSGKIDLSPLRLAGAIPVHPGFVRLNRSKFEMEKPETPFFTLDMVDKFLKLALPIGSNKDHPITCPMGSAAPPMEGLKLLLILLCVAVEDLV
ncbi:Alpha/beta hydrolase fold-3 [Dillenia turbinata]|uniref:Alpha/beta hydrolase fold-3 n=1 Tax=Dillenia turbinata TaxID=194707 RepID=A0AAN8VV61_9MAGN